MNRSRRLRTALAAALATAFLTSALAPQLVAPTAPAASSAEVASPFPATADLQRMLDYLVEDGATPGVVLGIVEPDGSTRILHAGTAGADTRPLGPETVFEIGSINKTFTAAILADMVAKGEVALTDPVQQYLPDYVRVPERNGRQITLLDLATHRSGLPTRPNGFVLAETGNPFALYTVDLVYGFLNEHELRRDIGAEFEYSNLGFGLLGHALGRAAGMEFRDLVRARVLEPLGMSKTGFVREGELAAWHAKGHGESGEVVQCWDAGDAVAGAGGLRADIRDMLVWLRAQIGPAETDLERAMRAAHELRQEGPPFGVGLAWQIRTLDGNTLISQGGKTAGFRAMMGFDPARRTGFVLLANSGEFDDDLPIDFLVDGPPLDLPVVDVSREVLASYVGEYELAPGRTCIVRLEENGAMTLRLVGKVRFQMHADSDGSFFLKRAPWRVVMTKDESGRVIGLTLDDGESAPRAARKVGDEAPLPGEVRDLTMSKEEMEAHVGTYALRMGERSLTVLVFVEAGRLMVQPADEPPSRLLAQGRGVFVPDGARELRLVFTLEDGRATELTLIQGGREVRGPRTR